MRRITILRKAKHLYKKGNLSFMCICLKAALKHEGFLYNNTCVKDIFPEFNNKTAIEKFNADALDGSWWNDIDENNYINRMNYFNYLIDFYKDDKTDIKKEFKQWLETK